MAGFTSISFATAAAARAIKAGGRPSAVWLVAPRSLSSRSLSQLTMGFDEIEKWKKSKAKWAEKAGTETPGGKKQPTIFDLKMYTPINKSSVWNISYTPGDDKKTKPTQAAALVSGAAQAAQTRDGSLKARTTTKAMTANRVRNPTPKEPKSSARLSESPEICDPTDPDNDLGVDHRAFYERQVALFQGRGPFFF